MKANEFIKKFGIFGAKEYLAGATFFDDHLFVFTDIDELKRIVESHKLVDNLGGLEEAKNYLSLSNVRIGGLKQSIKDVESCL